MSNNIPVKTIIAVSFIILAAGILANYIYGLSRAPFNECMTRTQGDFEWCYKNE